MLEQSLRVLLIDDDEDDFLITRDLFDDIGYYNVQLDWVEEVEEALAVISEQRHDLYLLDYHLGILTGLDVLTRALSLGSRSPFIMLTGQGGRQVDLKAMEMGAYDFLVKGEITAALLERSIRYSLQHAQTLEALRSTVRLSSSLLTALNHVVQGVFVVDMQQANQPIIFANSIFLNFCEMKRSDILGRPLAALSMDELCHFDTKGIEQSFLMSEPYKGDWSCDTQDYSLEMHPVRSSAGVVTHFVGLSTHI